MESAEVEVRLLFFAKSRELVGRKEDTIKLPIHLLPAGLWEGILAKHPCLQPISDNITIALNQEYIAREETEPIVLKEGDEIAIIPPLSGG
ncbi:uncharacterized protein LOC144355848 [Saccoglossus kowalevskii]